MKLETFFNNFDLLADAPNSVQKLRELILQLAVVGKLVPQDANDEPASVLLEKIKAEKQRLIEENKISKEKPLPPINTDEVSYILPKGWMWVRLGDICSFLGGYAFKSSSYVKSSNNQVIRLGNVKNNQILLEQSPAYVPDEVALENEKALICVGDILITMTGTRNKRDYCFTAVVEHKHIAHKNLYLNQRVGCLRVTKPTIIQLVNIFLKSSSILDLLLMSETGTANQGNIGADALRNVPFPLPPLAEQHRIVAKVDELMAMCDRISSRQQQKRETRIIINNAAIGQLLTAREPEVFNKSWQHICNNFDLLYSTPDNIGKLRQAILQLAVQGKLVPQDENDEPASVLLEKIRANKQRLIEEKKISKEKPLPPIETDEVFYTLPEGWMCVRLGDICSFLGGYAFKSSSYVKSSNNQVIRLGNVKNNQILLEQSPAYVPDEVALENEKALIRVGDILITMTGTRNKRDYCFTAVVEHKHIAHKNLYLNQRVGCLRVTKPTIIQLVNIFLKSSSILDLLLMSETGTANQGNIGADALRNVPFLLPPLAEQKRIITKLNQLMSLCDELETKLTQSVTDSEKLIDTAVHQILAANGNKIR
jgi:type I restriction enzyme, S subunit